MEVIKFSFSASLSLDDTQLGAGLIVSLCAPVNVPVCPAVLVQQRPLLVVRMRLHTLPQLHQQLLAVARRQIPQVVLRGQLHQPAAERDSFQNEVGCATLPDTRYRYWHLYPISVSIPDIGIPDHANIDTDTGVWGVGINIGTDTPYWYRYRYQSVKVVLEKHAEKCSNNRTSVEKWRYF